MKQRYFLLTLAMFTTALQSAGQDSGANSSKRTAQEATTNAFGDSLLSLAPAIKKPRLEATEFGGESVTVPSLEAIASAKKLLARNKSTHLIHALERCEQGKQYCLPKPYMDSVRLSREMVQCAQLIRRDISKLPANMFNLILSEEMELPQSEPLGTIDEQIQRWRWLNDNIVKFGSTPGGRWELDMTLRRYEEFIVAQEDHLEITGVSNRFQTDLIAAEDGQHYNKNMLEIIPEEMVGIIRALPLAKMHIGPGDLSGLLPKSIARFYNLECLFLSRNSLKRLPHASIQLVNLKYLDLASNRLAEIDSLDGISGLTVLEHLNIENNALTAIPDEVFELKELQILRFAGNHIQHLPTEQIKNLTKLVEVSMGNDKYPAEIDAQPFFQALKTLNDFSILSIPAMFAHTLLNCPDKVILDNGLALNKHSGSYDSFSDTEEEEDASSQDSDTQDSDINVNWGDENWADYDSNTDED
jgi:hypothetical protein